MRKRTADRCQEQPCQVTSHSLDFIVHLCSEAIASNWTLLSYLCREATRQLLNGSYSLSHLFTDDQTATHWTVSPSHLCPEVASDLLSHLWPEVTSDSLSHLCPEATRQLLTGFYCTICPEATREPVRGPYSLSHLCPEVTSDSLSHLCSEVTSDSLSHLCPEVTSDSLSHLCPEAIREQVIQNVSI